MLEKLNRRIIAGIFNGEIRLKTEINQRWSWWCTPILTNFSWSLLNMSPPFGNSPYVRWLWWSSQYLLQAPPIFEHDLLGEPYSHACSTPCRSPARRCWWLRRRRVAAPCPLMLRLLLTVEMFEYEGRGPPHVHAYVVCVHRKSTQ